MQETQHADLAENANTLFWLTNIIYANRNEGQIVFMKMLHYL
jgi:hypothetical protein